MGTEDENNNSEYQFIKETIKERPVNKKKVLTRIIMILISALLFGAVSAGVFILTVRQYQLAAKRVQRGRPRNTRRTFSVPEKRRGSVSSS